MTAEMTTSPEILYARKGAEPALIIKLKDLSRLDNPEIARILKQIGLTTNEFGKILRLEFVSTSPIKSFPWRNERGQKVEDVVERSTVSSVGPLEVADVKLYPDVIVGHDDVSLHLKTGKHGGFEAILALKGTATLSFPKEVKPVSFGVYTASSERDHIVLTSNTLAIIPAPTANYWSIVGEGFEFRYICQPKWSSDFVRQVMDR